MKGKLLRAYERPQEKVCFYTGHADSRVGKALGREVWDWTPVPSVNVEPWYWNTHTLALAFGCEAVFTSEGKEWIADLITDPAQVRDLEVPDVRSGRTGQILEEMERLLEEHPDDHLIRLPDIQSPLGVAELMWDQGFYLSLLTHPREVHLLLEKITAFSIAYVMEIQRLLGARYNPACHPQVWAPPVGYYMSDDVNSMLSPEQHMEFSIQYLNRITRELGPLFYHSCTWTDPYFENLEGLEGVRAANWSFGTSADPARLLERFSGKFVLIAHIDKGVHEEEGIAGLNKNIHSAYDLCRYMLDHMQDDSSLCLWFQPDLCEDVEQMVRIYRLMEERGFAP